MCGIAGYSLTRRSTDTSVSLRKACVSLSHRGPDDYGVFEDSTCAVGLAHSRLSILDTSSHGHQPMLSSDGRVALVFNGEIYNHSQLRIELELAGFEFFGHSDTEVLMNLYLFIQREGLDLASMLHRLNGIFAFALWDVERAHLFLARDALGVKPLYFTQSLDSFVFASEIKSLLPFTGTFKDIDVLAIHSYLSFLWCPGVRTPASSVKKILPGEFIIVNDGQIARRSIWYKLPFFNTPLVDYGESEAITLTRDCLRKSVHSQLVSDVPVGAFLSGGLDSSSVVAFARERNPNLRCFTIDVNTSNYDGFSDDLPFARLAADYLDVPLDVVQVDSTLMASSIEKMVWHLDEPIADPAALHIYFISCLAREQGIKVLLSGVGGDDLFTGYRRHHALSSEFLWRWLPSSIRNHLRQLSHFLPVNYAFTRRLRKAFSGFHLDGDQRLIQYFRWIERSDLSALFTPSFRSALHQSQDEDPLIDFLSELPNQTPTLNRMLALEQRFFLADHNLTYTDKMSMAAGVEVRVPFLDQDLVKFASTLPLKYKQRGRESKWVLKKAMEPYLPRELIYRSKTGFGVPLRHWLRFELRDWLSDILSIKRLDDRGLFNSNAVQNLIEANYEGLVDASYTLLSLACIEIWCCYFIDRSIDKSSPIIES